MMDNINTDLIDKRIGEVVPQMLKGNLFTGRKLTDTPTDDLQVVNKRYCDANSGSAVYGRIYLNGGQSINNTTDTKVLFDTTDVAVGITADVATNREFVVQTAGGYMVSAQLWYASVDASKTHDIYILKNGSVVVQTRMFSAIAGNVSIVATWVGTLAVSDTIQLYTWQNNGSAKSLQTGAIYTYLQINKV